VRKSDHTLERFEGYFEVQGMGYERLGSHALDLD
jgi:hypothetical protein